MEQEQALFQLKNIGKGTGEILLKGILALLEKSKEEGKAISNVLSKNGELNWNKFMSSDASKEIKRFRTSEINLQKLKEYLKQYGVKFSIKELGNNDVALAFEAKNSDVIRDAFEHLVSDVTEVSKDDKTKEAVNSLVKDPEAKSFDERLKNAKEETAQKIAVKEAQEKQLRQSQGKGKLPKKDKLQEEVIKE